MKKFATLGTFLLGVCLGTPVQGDGKVFPISTEMQIARIKGLVDRAPKGIYLTVGGERAFRGGSMFEGIEHLVICDLSPIITRFNKINRELLKAPHKEAYKKLRWESTFAEWQKISAILTEDDFKWWDDHIRHIKGYDLPEHLNRYGEGNRYIKFREKMMAVYPNVAKKFNNNLQAFLNYGTWSDIESHLKDIKNPITKEEFSWFEEERKISGGCITKFIDDPSTAVDWAQVIDYKQGNYLFDDRLYQRLHQLVLDEKVTILEVDFTKDMELLDSTIKKIGSKLAVLDMDNLYRYEYMGEEKFRTALDTFLSWGDKKSILILMNNYKDFPCAQFSIYVGFTFEHVQGWPKDPFIEAFFTHLPHAIQPLLDGRLYEGKDDLPFYLKS